MSPFCQNSRMFILRSKIFVFSGQKLLFWCVSGSMASLLEVRHIFFACIY